MTHFPSFFRSIIWCKLIVCLITIIGHDPQQNLFNDCEHDRKPHPPNIIMKGFSLLVIEIWNEFIDKIETYGEQQISVIWNHIPKHSTSAIRMRVLFANWFIYIHYAFHLGCPHFSVRSDHSWFYHIKWTINQLSYNNLLYQYH